MRNPRETRECREVGVSKLTVGNTEMDVVDAHELWEVLESKQAFVEWINEKVIQYGYVQGTHFIQIDNFKECVVSLNMAKDLSLIEQARYWKTGDIFNIDFDYFDNQDETDSAIKGFVK